MYALNLFVIYSFLFDNFEISFIKIGFLAKAKSVLLSISNMKYIKFVKNLALSLYVYVQIRVKFMCTTSA